MTCLFLFMGQSNKDGNFDTVFAITIMVEGTDGSFGTVISEDGILLDGDLLIGEDDGKGNLRGYTFIGPATITIDNGDDGATLNSYGLGFYPSDNPDEFISIIGHSSEDGGFIFLFDEYGNDIFSKP